MSAHSQTIHIPPPERLVPGKYALTPIFLALSIIGIIVSCFDAAANRVQFAYSWFFAFCYFFTIALGAFFWVVLHYACDSNWTVLVRRVWENIIGLFLLFFVLFLPLLWPGTPDILWQYMSPSVQITLNHAKDWLNSTSFYIRAFIYFIYFILAGHYYRRCSVEQDIDGNPVLSRRMHDWSYPALVIFGVFVTGIGCDWLMGLDWHWYSSLFGVYTFAVCAQAGMAAGIVLVAIFRSAGFLNGVNHEHYYLMGKLLFAFTIFWAYIAFGQFLLIWYGNIPEEAIFYNDHNRGHWVYLSYLLIVGKFMFPAIYLLAQDTKKSLRALTRIAVWILIMHAVELYWFIMPYAHPTIGPRWQDLVSFVTVGSILGYAYIRLTASASLIPTRDPRIVDCLIITN
jgi:hypothetical protein